MRATSREPLTARPLRILIVEDDADQARALESLLRRHGYETATLSTGFEGEDAAASDRFDAILLDLMLPDRDGIDVARNLRRRRVNTVIIMLTGMESLDSTILGLDMGADDYMTKPYAPDELLARLRAKLALARRVSFAPS